MLAAMSKAIGKAGVNIGGVVLKKLPEGSGLASFEVFPPLPLTPFFVLCSCPRLGPLAPPASRNRNLAWNRDQQTESVLFCSLPSPVTKFCSVHSHPP